MSREQMAELAQGVYRKGGPLRVLGISDEVQQRLVAQELPSAILGGSESPGWCHKGNKAESQ